MADHSEDKFIHIPVKAQINDASVDTDDVRTAINAVIAAAVTANEKVETALSPIGENQKPRMLRITAWICHAGPPNRNGAAFIEEDLEEAVSNGLFQAPYFGMIDYNHDFQAYGAWYKAEYKYDPVARQYGILAEGALFAWRYEELADKMLAMQVRQGHIDVSMACIPDSYEYVEPENGGSYILLRKPVFFTTSVLDVEPADPHARGLGTEDSEQIEHEREHRLNRATIETSNKVASREDNMDELIDKVEKLLGEHKADLAPLVEAAQKVPLLEAEIASAVASKESVEMELANEQTAKQTVEVALEAMRSEIETANETISTLTAELEELRAFKEAVEAAEAEKAAQELLEARLDELGEAFRTSLFQKSKDVQGSILARLKTMEEDEWTDYKTALNLVSVKSFADRSETEGTMVMTTDKGGESAISKWIKR